MMNNKWIEKAKLEHENRIAINNQRIDDAAKLGLTTLRRVGDKVFLELAEYNRKNRHIVTPKPIGWSNSSQT